MTKEFHKGRRIPSRKRSFRRWVKQLFTSWIKLQNCEAVEVLVLLQGIRDSIEIIAREMARQSKRGKK